ncbi:MAG TPA: hypothetical protein P5230_02705 [Candidatus Magasanikbacteria bacterium]|nr:hypothetical protein [Candidatus Magasanikbacteria bacterium]
MIGQLAFSQILGLPAVAWGGMFTFLCFLFTAYIGYKNTHGNMTIPPKWHFLMAYISLALGLFHGLLGMLAFLGY